MSTVSFSVGHSSCGSMAEKIMTVALECGEETIDQICVKFLNLCSFLGLKGLGCQPVFSFLQLIST